MENDEIGTPRKQLNGDTYHGTELHEGEGKEDTFALNPIIHRGSKKQEEQTNMIEEQKAKRTGINLLFDSIMIGISSAVCFGLLAGMVIGVWAIPIGIIAGFYLAYRTNQKSQN